MEIGDKVISKVTGYEFTVYKYKTNMNIDDVVFIKSEMGTCIQMARSYFEEKFEVIE